MIFHSLLYILVFFVNSLTQHKTFAFGNQAKEPWWASDMCDWPPYSAWLTASKLWHLDEWSNGQVGPVYFCYELMGYLPLYHMGLGQTGWRPILRTSRTILTLEVHVKCLEFYSWYKIDCIVESLYISLNNWLTHYQTSTTHPHNSQGRFPLNQTNPFSCLNIPHSISCLGQWMTLPWI